MSVTEAIALLRAAGVPSPEHDARALERHARQARVEFDELVRRRAQRTPLQHLVGTTGFRYLDLQVGPGVFIPRPETELVAQAVLDEIGPLPQPLVVDLCAGSGAIGYSVAREHPRAVVHLVERDADAFAWLRRNRPPARDGVHLHLADAADALPGLDGQADVVVSNPPYVSAAERALVDPEVRDHDPAIAVFAGHDGLDVIRLIERAAWRLLKPDGLFVVEHSDRQGETVPALLHSAGWVEIADHDDLTGRPRFAVARRPAVTTQPLGDAK